MALEALRDVLLQVSSDYARQKLRDSERAEERSYHQSLIKDEREYAKALRDAIRKEDLEGIGAQVEARIQAERKALVFVQDTELMRQALSLGLKFDPQGDRGSQIETILKAKEALMKREVVAKMMAEADARITAAEAFYDRGSVLKKKEDTPIVEANQANIEAARQRIAEAEAQADEAQAAVLAPIEKAYKLSVYGLDPQNPMHAGSIEAANKAYSDGVRAAAPQLNEIARTLSAKVAAYSSMMGGAGREIAQRGGQFFAPQDMIPVVPTAPLERTVRPQPLPDTSMQSAPEARGFWNSIFRRSPAAAPAEPVPMQPAPVSSLGPVPAPVSPSAPVVGPVASASPPYDKFSPFWTPRGEFAYRDDKDYVPILDDALILGGNAVQYGAGQLGNWLKRDWGQVRRGTPADRKR